jgi:hypothetical protein
MTVNIYSQILEYQIKIARHYKHRFVARLLSDLTVPINWKNIKEGLEKTEKSIKDTMSVADSHKINRGISDLQNKAKESLTKLMKVEADIEAKAPCSGLIAMLIFFSRIFVKTND